MNADRLANGLTPEQDAAFTALAAAIAALSKDELETWMATE